MAVIERFDAVIIGAGDKHVFLLLDHLADQKPQAGMVLLQRERISAYAQLRLFS